MKKIFCLILALTVALSGVCFFDGAASFGGGIVAHAESFETEKGVKVEMAPFLYKSTLYQMEFPSHQSYEIKEKSEIGDYAISREINNLSYSFTFPAGTTEIACKVSLDGENEWRGYTINSTDNSNYWPKDGSGSVDYTKEFTFKRDELTAERDEYGVLYRDFLRDADVKGFRDYNKIYWRLTYTCKGEEFTEYFDVELYDYDKAEKKTVRTVNFNVAGLPFAALSGTDVGANQSVAGKYLSSNNFDIVAVQEDFNYHSDLVASMNGFNNATLHMGNIPGGDGLNVFTKNMTIYNETRVPWNEASGILSDGSDELTPKGFVYTVIDIGNGIYVDFYNLHADAYGGAGSVAARTSQFRQLADFIKARSAENDRPVIVTGDFNYYLHSRENNSSLYNILCVELGLKDAWVEYHNDGNYLNMDKWGATGLHAWGNWDSVERFMYKSGGGVDLMVEDFRYATVKDANGVSISDHTTAECDFTFIKTEDFVENTGKLQVTEAKEYDFIYRLTWFIKALTMILSDLGNLPELLKEI